MNEVFLATQQVEVAEGQFGSILHFMYQIEKKSVFRASFITHSFLVEPPPRR